MDVDNIIQSIGVSFISLSVIFLVLGILIFVIKILVYLLPYKASDIQAKKKNRGSPQKTPVAPGGPDNVLVAVVTSAMASYLGKSPDQIRITNIKAQN